MKHLTTNFKHSTQVQIRFTDIDTAGHVNNTIFPCYYDYARIKYFNRIFGNVVEWRTFGVVIVNFNIDYLKPIFLEDLIVVDTKITNIGNKSMEMIQQIRLKDKPEIIKSKSKTTYVGYHYKDNYSFRIPEQWRKMISDFENK